MKKITPGIIISLTIFLLYILIFKIPLIEKTEVTYEPTIVTSDGDISVSIFENDEDIGLEYSVPCCDEETFVYNISFSGACLYEWLKGPVGRKHFEDFGGTEFDRKCGEEYHTTPKNPTYEGIGCKRKIDDVLKFLQITQYNLVTQRTEIITKEFLIKITIWDKIKEKLFIVCNKPYIHVGIECCLDKDDNKICDKDELVEQKQEEEKEEAQPEEQQQKLEEEEEEQEEEEKTEEELILEEIIKIGLQSGYLEPTEGTYRDYDGNKISYLCYNIEDSTLCEKRELSVTDMEKRLLKAIENKFGSSKVTVTILDEKLIVRKDNKNYEFSYPLGELYKVSQDILDLEATSGEFDQLSYMLSHHGLYRIEKLRPYPDKIYKINKQDSIYVFQFAIQGEPL